VSSVPKGHGERLSRKQETAIVALLVSRTQQEAAKSIGVHPRTLTEWQRDPVFAAAFRDARRRAVDQAVTRLQQLCGKAVTTLDDAMSGEDMNVAVRAAKIVLDMAMRGVEIDDLARQVEELQRRQRRMEGKRESRDVAKTTGPDGGAGGPAGPDGQPDAGGNPPGAGEPLDAGRDEGGLLADGFADLDE
jgi:hypothetical protein